MTFAPAATAYSIRHRWIGVETLKRAFTNTQFFIPLTQCLHIIFAVLVVVFALHAHVRTPFYVDRKAPIPICI